jgi:hypothetical protein
MTNVDRNISSDLKQASHEERARTSVSSASIIVSLEYQPREIHNLYISHHHPQSRYQESPRKGRQRGSNPRLQNPPTIDRNTRRTRRTPSTQSSQKGGQEKGDASTTRGEAAKEEGYEESRQEGGEEERHCLCAACVLFGCSTRWCAFGWCYLVCVCSEGAVG